MTATNAVTEEFLAAAERFADVVRHGGSWDAASPCEGWTAADVLDHVISTERDFLQQHGADLGPAPGGDPDVRWSQHLDAVGPVLTAEFAGRGFDGFFGPTTVGATLQTFYTLDLIVHRWDLGRALGQHVTLSAADADHVERSLDTVGDAIYAMGASKPALEVSAAAPRATRVLGRLGRAA